jgi:hypothetical protein
MRDRQIPLEDVDRALLIWFRSLRASNILGIQGQDLLEKAKDFANSLGHTEVEISMSWINRWKDRHMVRSLKICGEGANVEPQQLTDWNEAQLPIILKTYSSNDIFNADECGLFWRMLPERTLAFKGEKCIGGKSSKERITVMVCSNMSGTQKLPLWVIGKSRTPRCFRGVMHLPVTWKWNSKAWMTSALFREYILTFNAKMKAEKRNVALIIDNCPAHVKVESLSNITIFFLPPNTTSHTQPMDAGVIHNMKANFRRRLVRKKLIAFHNNSQFCINMLDALHMLKDSWDNVTSTAISNCFRTTFRTADNFSNPATDTPIQIEDDFDDLMNWETLKTSGFLNKHMTFLDYVEIDDEVSVAAVPNDNEIIERMDIPIDENSNENLSENEETSENIQIQVPTIAESLKMVVSLRRLLETLHDGPTITDFRALTQIEKLLETTAIRKLNQKKITDFFN